MMALGFFGFLAAAAEPPRMLFLEPGIHDPGAAGGTRIGFAFLRKDDGSFAFYNPYAPSAEPLVLPDAEGKRHALRPGLPVGLAASSPASWSER